MNQWTQTLYDLVVRTSTDIPADVESALSNARDREEPESNAARALDTMLENIASARMHCRPLCQDTGTLMFCVEAPMDLSQAGFRQSLADAIRTATSEGILRQNCVETLTGRNTGDNLGDGSPVVHWRERESEKVRVGLVLKGGGCENVGAQYALPSASLGAGRDLEGVRRCMLDAVWRAQGQGCAPGVLSVAVGGDRATGYERSKQLLLRRIGQKNAVPELAALEKRTCEEANQLGIGPMGFGGRTTLLDVFLDTLCRVPASYFVSISYMCWAYRRRIIETDVFGSHVRDL